MTIPMEFKLVIYGATPAGVAMAVRAARAGLSVLLVTHTPHLGGMLSSGLCVWDTLHEGRRSPIYDEVRAQILEHYKTTYGADSPQYRAALPGASGHSNGNFEPRVARQVIERLVEREPLITVKRGFIPAQVRSDDRTVKSISFTELDGAEHFEATGDVFADCSYEGDLLALAGVAYAVGREARQEFDEALAGRTFMRNVPDTPENVERYVSPVHRGLKLRRFPEIFERVETFDSGQPDVLVQAYNWRTVLTDDPQNRIPIPEPAQPVNVPLEKLERPGLAEWLPNRKCRVNRPQLIGRQNSYVEGGWAARRVVMDEHWNAFLATVRFLQNDPSVPEETRRRWSEFGLARDEFEDNGYRPYEIYARETRRMRGRYVFSEHDVLLAPGLHRAPVHADSIAATDWYIDSHACSDAKLPGTLHEGKVIAFHSTFPGQVPLRAILPREFDNLLVPVCVSSTHIGWSAVRLEPTWMTIGESAGFLAALAVQQRTPAAQVNVVTLQRKLASQHVMLGFFNDVQPGDAASPAVQFFSTKGFFADYDARPNDALALETGKIWADAFAALLNGSLEPPAVAQRVFESRDHTATITNAAFRALLPEQFRHAIQPDTRIAVRGDILRRLFDAIAAHA